MLLQYLTRPLVGCLLLIVSLVVPVAPVAAADPARAAQASAPAAAQPGSQQSALPSVPAPPVAAASWVLIDLTSTQTLHERASNEKREPASLTKLMTAYLVF